MKRTNIKTSATALLLYTLLSVSGCANTSAEDIGTIAGAAIGAAVASEIADGDNQTIAVIGGAVLGGYIGHKIGGYMDKRDRERTAAALEQKDAQVTSSWTNPDTGYKYRLNSTDQYTNHNNLPCRAVTIAHTAPDSQRTEHTNGTACRNESGTWSIN